MASDVGVAALLKVVYLLEITQWLPGKDDSGRVAE